MSFKDACEEWKRFDEDRDSLPGEHWLTAAAGAGLLVAATRSNCRVTAAIQALAGSALLFRAGAGRDGLRSLCGSKRDRDEDGDDGSAHAPGRRSYRSDGAAGTRNANPADPNLGRS